MISFLDAASEILAPWATPEQVRAAAVTLGPDAREDLESLALSRKTALVAQLVSHLGHLAVDQVLEVQRQLQSLLQAEPRGESRLDLQSAPSIVELRNHLRQVFASQGHSWEALLKLQAGVCGLARWLQVTGPSTAIVAIDPKAARITLSVVHPELTAEAVQGSPMLLALKPLVKELAVSRRGGELVVEFFVPAA